MEFQSYYYYFYEILINFRFFKNIIVRFDEIRGKVVWVEKIFRY